MKDINFLYSLTPTDFHDWIKSQEKDYLQQQIDLNIVELVYEILLYFADVKTQSQSDTDKYKAIFDHIKSALKIIAEDSRLNKMRVTNLMPVDIYSTD